MGRHRRVGAAGASEEQHPADTVRTGGTHSHRRAKRASVPVRTGLLGVSAAVAMGAVAVASGLIPGDAFSGDGNESSRVQSAGSPTDLETQGGASASPDRPESPASRGSDRPEPSKTSSSPTRSASPSKSPSPSSSSSSSAPSPEKSSADAGAGGAEKKAEKPKSEQPVPAKPEAAPAKPSAPSPDSGQAAEAEVLSLVNQERAQAGCSPVTADAALADLAGDFSEDMAERGFFDHTDPDGDTPWDRAEQAGVTNLGGENIARGQTNAQSVMDSWMASPGHRANILNCEYRTLGVGAHFAPGGPWWTQDFGF
ncbi:CAP domain-containing protein [Streptomyces sp. B-S-A8]|uniref:CAP domain-containing protein n=1 Tax=Streptomyces solicavernae TaxID=3043614 RepID=A0ABT6RVD9_9ACTN|nr:CAP domain-containing protein [Streptomyces sp. B-S-A8]MDI3388416.1 CAP domain-containing protein [Streptomyces sp. B-S-A8]